MTHSKTNELLMFSLIVALEFIALYSIKLFSQQSNNRKYLYLSMFCYGIIPILLFYILQITHQISTINVTWNILSTLYGFAIGVWIYKEDLSNRQILGVVLGTIALILVLK